MQSDCKLIDRHCCGTIDRPNHRLLVLALVQSVHTASMHATDTTDKKFSKTPVLLVMSF